MSGFGGKTALLKENPCFFFRLLRAYRSPVWKTVYTIGKLSLSPKMGIYYFFVILYFNRTHFVQEGSLHRSLKSHFFTYDTCTWGTILPPYLSLFVSIFVVSYHLVLMFSWSPIGPLLCGSTIKSPLFRASKLSHHRIHGVYPESLCSSP